VNASQPLEKVFICTHQPERASEIIFLLLRVMSTKLIKKEKRLLSCTPKSFQGENHFQ
jgi:hypothetical protein